MNGKNTYVIDILFCNKTDYVHYKTHKSRLRRKQNRHIPGLMRCAYIAFLVYFEIK